MVLASGFEQKLPLDGFNGLWLTVPLIPIGMRIKTLAKTIEVTDFGRFL